MTKGDGTVEYLPVTVPGAAAGAPAGVAPAPDKLDTIISFIERSPEILEKIKALIPQKKKKEESAEEPVAEAATETVAEVAEATAE